jgi:predicted ATP-dependent endonuclease of OLD family
MMILKRFRVKNFRSVKDSGWIDCDSVTSLVGINEAGKSNLILALWKLNPARNEDDAIIDALHDMPAAEYSSWRDKPEDIEFITGEFEMEDTLSSSIADKCNCDPAAIATVRITRSYDEHYSIGFPNLTVLGSDIKRLAESSKEKANTDDESSVKLRKFCDDILAYVESKATLIETECDALTDIIKDGVPKGKGLAEFNKLKSGISQAVAIFGDSSPSDNKDVQDMIIDNMPKFVYYSNYGNLDAQIYLPHVVKLLKGEAIPGFDNRAKVRTLRVLFDFVNLKPQEVLDLGKDPETLVKQTNGQYAKQEPKPEEIAKATKQKEERTTLLNSASTKLTREFKNWWKQGSYTFRLQADGDFFKIWVSDDKRPEEIELERRSTGLQWFLSFFLIFLVERADAHKGAILLLDEAGLTLHPLAQKDLVGFFENLSTDNQIIHTTHSPFLIDTSNIDRVKVVYSDKDGHTVAADDLRAADDSINEKSIYAVRSALGLTVSDILLQGCQPVIVEGTSDQYYLNAIKLYLISKGKMAPTKELIFMPAGGCTNKAVKAIAGLVSGRNDDLPFIVLDSDKTAKSAKLQLSSELYKGSEDKIISIADVTPLDNSEVEDLIPVELMSRQIDRLFKEIDEEDFTNDFYDKSKPVVSQIESFAKRHFITLDKSWKVQLAKSVKQQLLQRKLEISDDYIGMWISLFNKINRVEV